MAYLQLSLKVLCACIPGSRTTQMLFDLYKGKKKKKVISSCVCNCSKQILYIYIYIYIHTHTFFFFSSLKLEGNGQILTVSSSHATIMVAHRYQVISSRTMVVVDYVLF